MANTHSIDLEAGSSQCLSRADEALLSITGNMTIECWVRFESLPSSPNSMAFVTKRTVSGGNRSFVFNLTNSGGTYYLTLLISANGSTFSTSSVTWTPSTGVWYHVAAVYSTAGTVNFYVNGSAQGAQQTGANTSIFDGTATFAIGADFDGGSAGEFFDGLIDDVRLWSTTRTATEILTYYAQEIDTATNLVGSWHLNNVLTDASGNSLTLTNNNTATFSTTIPFTAFEVSDSSVTLDSYLSELGVSYSDSSVTTDSFSSGGFGFSQKSSTTWTNLNKS